MKLLIIEDEEKINTALCQGFEEEGFSVDGVLDGKSAQEMLANTEYDCIILDLMLPEIDGMSILKELRAGKNFTPVIILTARDEIQDKVGGLDTGADDYLAKPFSFNELLARVKAIIRRASTNQTLLQVDTLILDPYKKLVQRSGIDIHVTGKEFMLLEYLMRHKGALIPEDRIIQHVWDYEEDISSNVVAAHIKNLRSKIDKAFPKERPIIQTQRRLGYKIDG